jgi:ornithine cyclodeaminase/alanine dehydrogenase
MIPRGTLLLNRNDVAQLLGIDECIGAVERAFKMYGEGTVLPPGILGVHVKDGGFHIKAGVLDHAKSYFVAKVNANFPQNKRRFGLPTIQGIVILSNAENGYPLAVMDSIEITIQRTGASTAVAAKYLARSDSKVVTICGCGNQGRIQLRSLLRVRALKRAFVYDTDEHQARLLADEFPDELSVEPITKENLAASLRKSDICVTCTPSKQFFVNHDDVTPGTFIAGVGADSEEKQELDPALFTSNKIVVDVLEQCATIGDLHHALTQGLVKKSDVHAELGDIVAGKKPGRASNEEIIIFDSTGMALQDAAAAILVYEKAASAGIGSRLDFS